MALKRQRRTQEPAATAQPAPVRVQVTFSKVHNHRGVDFAKGDTLLATSEELILFRHFGVIEMDGLEVPV